MKKYVIVFLLGFVASWQLKGNTTLTPDNQVRIGGWSMPIPAFIQNSGIFTVVTSAVFATSVTPPQTTAYGRPGTATLSALPLVSSTTGTYNGSASGAAPLKAGDQFEAVAKVLNGR